MRKHSARTMRHASRTTISGVVRLLFLFLLCAFVALPLRAAEPGRSAWFETEQGRLRLVAAGEGEAGLQFEMAPGWKIYWRSPGDAGYPPTVDWKGSENLASAELLWPAPKRFTLFGLETVGYEKEVVLPVTVRLERAGRPMRLSAAVDYLTCNDICIPYQAELTLEGASQEFAPLLAAWRARLPGEGVRVESASLRPGRKPVLEVATAGLGGGDSDAFVEGPESIVFGAPRREGSVLVLPVEGTAPDRLVGESIRVTVVTPERAGEAIVRVAAGAPVSDWQAMLPILALALLGGLILNAMPCVLPVLSLKLLGLVDGRRGLLLTAAGIVASFLGLAAILIVLKSAGVAVGWGIQFQQPLFLAAMMTVLILFACNLFGFFELRLPGFAGDLAGRHGGHFATGVFATLLATPCSAPFLGTAVGFALAAGPLEIAAVFLTLGLGMSIPYLAAAAVPGIGRLMPRPGPWMVRLKQVLGLLLVGTAVWLATVLAAQAGMLAAALVGLALAAVAAVLALLPRQRGTAAAALVGAGLAAVLLLPSPPSAPTAELGWRSFEREAIDRLVAEGKTVFVDVTADWCVTCQVNKKLVLDSDRVAERLGAPHVVRMRADWTRPDPAISAYLRSFGRYGIPFNAVYGPGAPSGIALPELLTGGAVDEALERAKGAPKPPSERAIASVRKDG
jgi:suppressor for copper-sensitivity B